MHWAQVLNKLTYESYSQAMLQGWFNAPHTSRIVQSVLRSLAMSSLLKRLRGSASNNTPQHPRAEAVTSQSTNAPAASVSGAPTQHPHVVATKLHAAKSLARPACQLRAVLTGHCN